MILPCLEAHSCSWSSNFYGNYLNISLCIEWLIHVKCNVLLMFDSFIYHISWIIIYPFLPNIFSLFNEGAQLLQRTAMSACLPTGIWLMAGWVNPALLYHKVSFSFDTHEFSCLDYCNPWQRSLDAISICNNAALPAAAVFLPPCLLTTCCFICFLQSAYTVVLEREPHICLTFKGYCGDMPLL